MRRQGPSAAPLVRLRCSPRLSLGDRSCVECLDPDPLSVVWRCDDETDGLTVHCLFARWPSFQCPQPSPLAAAACNPLHAAWRGCNCATAMRAPCSMLLYLIYFSTFYFLRAGHRHLGMCVEQETHISHQHTARSSQPIPGLQHRCPQLLSQCPDVILVYQR